MSMDRFERLLQLPENMYEDEAPVLITKGALLRDTETGKVILQLKFKNIQEKTIKAIAISVTVRDSFGQKLGDTIEHQYIDLSANRNDEFGDKEAVFLTDSTTRQVELTCKYVLFTDGSKWESAGLVWESIDGKTLPKAILYNNALNILDANTIDELNNINEIVELLGDYKGAANLLNKLDDRLDEIYNNAVIAEGEASTEEAYKAAESLFRNINGFKDADVLADECFSKAEQIADERRYADEKKQKRKKTIIIVALAICLCVGAVFALIKVIIPAIKYNRAVNLMGEGKYTEAISVFSELEGFSDSANMISESKYQIAIDLMNKGKYNEAISAFSELNGFSDSATQILECKYQIADAYLTSKDYEKASDAFADLKDYKDALQKYCQSEFSKGELLFLEGDYLSAISMYKNAEKCINESEEKIDACYYELYQQAYENKDYNTARKYYLKISSSSNTSDEYKSLSYDLANDYLDKEDWLKAIELFEDLGEYKKSETLKLDAMYGYCANHAEHDNLTTYEYLTTLKSSGHSKGTKLYSKLYDWKATVKFYSENTGKEISRINENEEFSCTVVINGGTPGENANLKIDFEEGMGPIGIRSYNPEVVVSTYKINSTYFYDGTIVYGRCSSGGSGLGVTCEDGDQIRAVTGTAKEEFGTEVELVYCYFTVNVKINGNEIASATLLPAT